MTEESWKEAHRLNQAIKDGIRKRHNPRYNGDAPDWIVFPELRTGTGFSEKGASLQYIDIWAMNTWPSKRIMIAYEIKISRSDFLRELKSPKKRRLALFYSNEYYFATPAGMVKPEEVPAECGLMELQPNGRMKVVVDAPYRDCHPPSWHFVAALGRRVQELWRPGLAHHPALWPYPQELDEDFEGGPSREDADADNTIHWLNAREAAERAQIAASLERKRLADARVQAERERIAREREANNA